MSEQTDAPQPSGRRRRWRLAAVIALLAAVIPAVPIVIGVAISSAKPGAAKASANSFKPTPPAPPSNPQTTTTPATPTHHRQPGVLVALVQHPTAMRASPGGKTIAKLTTRTNFGSPQALWVQ